MYVKTTEIQLKEVEVVKDSFTLCDKCNVKIKDEGYCERFEFNFELEKGSVYSDSANYKRTEMNLCRDCSVELIGKLKEIGYRLTETEINY